jgi:hypothetical protein
LTIGAGNLHNGVMKRGQALAVVLLVMAVGITVALGAVTRSVTEVNVSSVQEEAARALEAAEVGVEMLVARDTVNNISGNLADSSAGYSAVAVEIGERRSYKLPYDLSDGDMGTFVMRDMLAVGPPEIFDICWGYPGSDPVPAIEVVLYFKDRSGPDSTMKVSRVVLDPGIRIDGAVTSGILQSQDCDGTVFAYQYHFDSGTLGIFSRTDHTPLLVRVKMLYNGSNPQPVLLDGVNRMLPNQGLVVTSVGTAGDAVQKISASASDPDYPPMFDNAIFSGGGLSK